MYMRGKLPVLWPNGLILKGVTIGWIGGEEVKDTQPIENEQFNLFKGDNMG